MIPNADIRPGDVAAGTALALSCVVATTLALWWFDPPPPTTPPEAIRIRAVTPATFAAAGTSETPSPPIATTAPSRPRQARAARPPSEDSPRLRPRRRDAQALPGLEPESLPPEEASESPPTDPAELPSLAPEAADTDEAPADDPGLADAPADTSEGAAGGVDGEPDGLAALAIAAYREDLASWLAQRFAVHGTGLPRAQLARLRGRARITIDDARMVVDVQYTSSGNAAFDAAALATLEALRGQTVPAPPQAFPGALQRVITVTFVCKASTCD